MSTFEKMDILDNVIKSWFEYVMIWINNSSWETGTDYATE